MRRSVVVLSMLLVAPPATACHLHKVWNYPYPQKCEYTRVALAYKPKEDLKDDSKIKKVLAPVQPDPIKDIFPICLLGKGSDREYGLCLLKHQLDILYANKLKQ